MSKQIGNRSISQKGLQPNLLFTIGPAPDSSKPLILKAKLENEPASRQVTETATIKETKTKPVLQRTGSKSPTPIKGGARVSASPDTSMISQKSTAKGKFFKGEESSATKKIFKDSRSNSKEGIKLLSHKSGLEGKPHMDSKNSLSTRDESVDKAPKKMQKKTYDVLFEFSEEESAPQKLRSKSPVKENLDPAKKPMNYINPKTSTTPKEEPERDRSSTKKSTIQSRPSKYFESEGTENNNSKKNEPQENVVSADDIQRKLQILRKSKGLKKTDSKTELIIDHALRNKISDELVLGSTGKTPKNFALKGVSSPNQKIKKTTSQTEQSLKALISSSIVVSKDNQPKTHIRRESSPTNRTDLSFAADKARLSAKKLNLRSPTLLIEEKGIPEAPNPKSSITPNLSKSTTKIVNKKEVRDTSFDNSMISPRIPEKTKIKTLNKGEQDTRQSLNKSPILNQSQVLTHSTTSLKFKKDVVDKGTEKPAALFQTTSSAKKEDLTLSKSRTSTAKKTKKTTEEEAGDRTTIQPSKNSDFFFQMNFFKPIDESKLDEFIQNVNETKTKQTSETEPSVLISPRLDHRSSLSGRIALNKMSSSLTPRDLDRSKLESERLDKEKIEKLVKERSEKLEKEKIQKEKAKQLEREKAEKEKSEKEKPEKPEKERTETARKTREKVTEIKEKAERDKTAEKDKADKSPDVSRLNIRVSKEFNNVAKLPKSKSPSHKIESMPVKQGFMSRDHASTKDLTGKSESKQELLTTETYSRLDQLLQELRTNIDKSQILDIGEDPAEKGLFSSENASESSSTSYSVNKSFAKNLIAFGNL